MKKSLLLGSLLLTTAGGFALTPLTPTPSGLLTPTAMAQAEETTAPESQASDNIKILDYGADERHVLRYAPQVGSTQRSTLRVGTDMAITYDGTQLPNIGVPEMIFVIDLTVDKIDDQGAIHSTFRYVEIQSNPTENTPPSLAELQKKQFEALKGATGTIIFDNRGNLQDFAFKLPESSLPNQQTLIEQLSRSIKQISNTLPADAVGVGAQWQAPQQISFNGIEIQQTATYTLQDFQDNQMQLDVIVDQAGTTSAAGISGLPEGVKITIHSLDTKGQGKLSHDLTQVMPTTMGMETQTEMEMGIDTGEKQSVFQADINMSLRQSNE